jgi:hypothetical protein
VKLAGAVACLLEPIVNRTRENVACEQAIIADRPLRRMRGLLGQTSLAVGEGILLMPAPSVHTAFMHFPIDVVFIDRELKVVKIASAVARGGRHQPAAHVMHWSCLPGKPHGTALRGDMMAIGETDDIALGHWLVKTIDQTHEQTGVHPDVHG